MCWTRLTIPVFLRPSGSWGRKGINASVLNYLADQRLLHMLGGDLLGSSHKENRGDCCKPLDSAPGQDQQKFGAGGTVSKASSQQKNLLELEQNKAILRNPAQLRELFSLNYICAWENPPSASLALGQAGAGIRKNSRQTSVTEMLRSGTMSHSN